MSNNNQQKNQQAPRKQGKQLRQVAILSGIAFQMAAITGIGAYIGHRIDQNSSREIPLATILGTFIGFGIAMYLVVKQVNKLNK